MADKQPTTRSNELIFVNAPKLTSRSRKPDEGPSARSSLIREAIRRKKAGLAKQLMDTSASNLRVFLNPGVFGKDNPETKEESVVIVTPRHQDSESSELEESEIIHGHQAFGEIDSASPRSLLSAARSDPFSPWNIELKSYGLEVLDYCVRDFWLTFRNKEYAELCYRTRFQQPSKLLVYSVLWAVAVHFDFNRGASPYQESAKCLRYFAIMLQLVQDELALSTAATVTDEIILAVLYIAVNYKVRGRIVRDPSPFTPPVLGIHHVDIFGTGEFHPLHWEALKDLIRGRGGLESIQMITLPWLVTLADLFHAVGCLGKPAYPLLDLTGKPIPYSPPCQALRIPQIPRPSEIGFAKLGLLEPPVHQSIIDTFQDIAEYSHCLDILSQRDSYSLDELGDCRDIIHHRLMSLPDDEVLCEFIMDLSGNPKPRFEAQHRTRFTYLLLRSAMLLYITHVTFPFPRPLLLRQRLLGDIASHFTKIGPDFPGCVPVELYLWPAVIAAIAARDEPCRALFVGIVRRLCGLRVVVTFEEFLVTMRAFAWVRCACDEGALGVWDEVRFSA
ncbi:hypothetical protein BJX66DRAFT_343086 [Aspergillus keveii]|uniref:C6 transcription factor n=1 Tax=Aspergillus keveii TaxID=714993 RepID=A0ABR4FQB1_9EURO